MSAGLRFGPLAYSEDNNRRISQWPHFPISSSFNSRCTPQFCYLRNSSALLILVVVTNWHFSCSFRLIVLNIYDPYLSRFHLVKPYHTRFIPFCLLTLFTDNENACIQTQNVANTTFILQRATCFKTKMKHKLYSIGVKPRARPSTTTPPPGSENPPYRSSRSSLRRHPLVCLLELEVPNDTRADH